MTAVSTTIISFLPVFTMVAAEGKLFRPLAFTKTFALLASLIVTLCVIPPLAHAVFTHKPGRQNYGWILYEGLIYLGGVLAVAFDWRAGLFVALMGGYNLLTLRVPARFQRWMHLLNGGLIAFGVALVLANFWRPLGLEKGFARNFIFVVLLIGGIIVAFRVFQRFYHRILEWCLN